MESGNELLIKSALEVIVDEAIFMQIDTSGLRSKYMKRSAFGVRRSKFKDTLCQNRSKSPFG